MNTKCVLSHLSALRWLLRHPNPRQKLPHTSRANLQQARFPSDVISRRLRWLHDLEDTQLEFLICESCGRKTKIARTRLCNSKLPAGSLIPIDSRIDDVSLYVTSPELTFVQLCYGADILQAIYYGCALCSDYRLDPVARGGVALRGHADPRLTSVSRLSSFVESAKGVPGASLARRALPYIHEHSRSPREAGLAMLFGLPVKYGGMALGSITLNTRIDVYEGKDAFGRSRTAARYPDILITARPGREDRRDAAVDYDSDSEHSGHEKKSLDVRRRNALATVENLAHYTLTTQDANDFRYLMLTGERIRRQLGVRAWPSIRGPLEHADNRRKISELEHKRFELWDRFIRHSSL